MAERSTHKGSGIARVLAGMAVLGALVGAVVALIAAPALMPALMIGCSMMFAAGGVVWVLVNSARPAASEIEARQK